MGEMPDRDLEEVYRNIKQEIGSSQQAPTKVVEKIFDVLEHAGISVETITAVAQSLYMRLFQELGMGDQNQARQSWVTASGNNFENLIRAVINSTLNQEGILAIKGDRLTRKPMAGEIVDFLTLRARRRCTQTSTKVWPDSDIVVLTKDSDGRLKVFALISCKTSDHGRNDSVMFWALALRETNIKYCLATMDLDNRFQKGDSDPGVSGHRKKAEAYLDRIYSTNPTTTECPQVFRLNLNQQNGASALLEDLRRWRKEIVPNFIDVPVNEEVLG